MLSCEAAGDGYVIQHGDNPEAKREFPGMVIRMWLPPAQAANDYPEFAAWLAELHARLS